MKEELSRKEWKKIILSKLFTSHNNKSKQIKSSEYRDTGKYPVIDQSELEIAGYYDDDNKVIKEGLPLIIFGDHTRHVKFIDFPFVPGADGTQILLPNPDFDMKFIYYLISWVSEKIGNHGYDRHFKYLKEFEVQYPMSRVEQKLIGEVLSKIDSAIVQSKELISKNNRIKKGLINDLITKGIDENGHIRGEDSHEFKDSPIGKIPKDWIFTNIGEIANHVRSGLTPSGGSSVYTKSGIMFLRSQNVYSDGLHLDDVAYISEEINNKMLGSEVFEHDVLLNITGASIGRSTYVPTNFVRANVNQHVCAIRQNNNSEYKAIFLSSFLNSPYGQSQIIRNNAGSNREGLNFEQIRNIQLALPKDEDEFARIGESIKKINNKLEYDNKHLKKLLRIKTGLIEDLLTRKISVLELLPEDVAFR